MSDSGSYYIPHGSKWPIIASIAVCTAMVGGSTLLNGNASGKYILFVGLALIVYMMVGWFSTVISESEEGLYDAQVDTSFRMGMIWFIFSEVMFFAAFFGALYYVRAYSLPWLGGEGTGLATNTFLWPNYEAVWPNNANGPGEIGGDFKVMGAWGLPAINTAILLTSGVTLTWAHHALKEMKRFQLIIGLGLTVLLGAIFMYFQALEYGHAFNDLNLNMGSGIYGSTFFMLTGFHGFHVTIGTIMLLVILARCIYGHFNPKNHFAFEAVAWYWHFVDVVWLGLFVFVYWL
jgi:cytochrome c oxidase subunit 3|tara:strand:- start:569 stop:1438 length:870 start_codon:yes stop_codon:yes gene_type:complete